jgi:hypothetical protein
MKILVTASFLNRDGLIRAEDYRIALDTNQRYENTIIAISELPILGNKMKEQILDLLRVNNRVTEVKHKERELKEQTKKRGKSREKDQSQVDDNNCMNEIHKELSQLKDEYGYLIDTISESNGIGVLEFITGSKLYKDLEIKCRALESGPSHDFKQKN